MVCIVFFFFYLCPKICHEKQILFLTFISFLFIYFISDNFILWCYFCLQDKFDVLNSEYQLIVLLEKVFIAMMVLIVLILIVLLS